MNKDLPEIFHGRRMISGLALISINNDVFIQISYSDESSEFANRKTEKHRVIRLLRTVLFYIKRDIEKNHICVKVVFFYI